MDEITIYRGIKAGETVCTGFGDQKSTAPEEPGTYSFVKLFTDDWQHAGFEWRKEEKNAESG